MRVTIEQMKQAIINCDSTVVHHQYIFDKVVESFDEHMKHYDNDACLVSDGNDFPEVQFIFDRVMDSQIEEQLTCHACGQVYL